MKFFCSRFAAECEPHPYTMAVCRQSNWSTWRMAREHIGKQTHGNCYTAALFPMWAFPLVKVLVQPFPSEHYITFKLPAEWWVWIMTLRTTSSFFPTWPLIVVDYLLYCFMDSCNGGHRYHHCKISHYMVELCIVTVLSSLGDILTKKQWSPPQLSQIIPSIRTVVNILIQYEDKMTK